MPTNSYTENQLGNQIQNPDQDLEDIADRILELDVMDDYDTEFADFFYQIQQDGAGGVPEGAIIMWSGDPDDPDEGVPDGWALCNGDNDTPDLRGEFIVGADANGDRYAVGDQGGSEQVTLSNTEMPRHRHGSGNLSGGSHTHGSGNLSTSNDGAHTHESDFRVYRSGNFTDSRGNNERPETTNRTTSTDGAHSHSVSGSTSGSSVSVSGTTSRAGSSQSHENRPPYYALAYIMKVS